MDHKYSELLKYLAEDPQARPFSQWVWGLAAYGNTVLCRAALAVGGASLGLLQQVIPGEEEWQRPLSSSTVARFALEAATRALAGGGSLPSDFGALVGEMREMVNIADAYVIEASGTAEQCALRERYVFAGKTILSALEAVTWSKERALAGISDEAERRAVADTGGACA